MNAWSAYWVAEDRIDPAVKRPTLYLETTIPSYLTARVSSNVPTAVRQRVTREWWQTRRNDFQIYVSTYVKREVSNGDPDAAQRRLQTIRSFPLLTEDSRVNILANSLVDQCALPAKAFNDARHIAIAATSDMQYLLTWNCAHLANEATIPKIRRICAANGCTCPLIVTPAVLLEVESNER